MAIGRSDTRARRMAHPSPHYPFDKSPGIASPLDATGYFVKRFKEA